MNQYQITVTRGDSRTLDFSDVVGPDGEAYDLNDVTGIIFRVDGLMRKTLSDFDVDESSGNILLDISAGDTEDAGDYRRAYPYELEFTITDVGIRTVRKGLFVVTEELTDPE
jgi:hypothetical protein